MPYRLSRVSQIWLVALSVGTVIALFGAVLGIIRYGELETQRNNDRIEFDKGSCERGNLFRQDVKAIARGSAAREQQVIRLLIGDRPETLERIEKLLAPAYDEFEQLVDSIKLNDCEKLLTPSRA